MFQLVVLNINSLKCPVYASILVHKMNNSVLLRNILVFNKDNERISYSHTCTVNRKLVSRWVPDRNVFRTLTIPKVLPSLFHNRGGIYCIDIRRSTGDLCFVMSMLGHTDLHRKGVSGIKWFNSVTKSNMEIDAKRSVIARFLLPSFQENDLILRERFLDNYDKSIIVQDKKEWRFVKPLLGINDSIVKFIFPRKDLSKICYYDIFEFISKRNSVKFIDITGDLSDESFEQFYPLFETLHGVAFRNTPTYTLDTLLSIVCGEASGEFKSLLLEGSNLSDSSITLILNILSVTDVVKLNIIRSSFPRNGFVKLLSAIGESSITRISFRKCKLSPEDIVSCLFLPSVRVGTKELSLAGIHIPECASSVMYSCVSKQFDFSLNRLSLENCNLGKNCLYSLAEGLLTSHIQYLDISFNDLGEISHKIFENIGVECSLKYLCIDNCVLCPYSRKELNNTINTYRLMNMSLSVDMKNVRF